MSNRDKEMIEHPNRWPLHPFLPVKREGWKNDNFANPQHFGVIHCDVLTIVIKTNIYMINSVGHFSDEELADKCSLYDSVDDLLADGWMVD